MIKLKSTGELIHQSTEQNYFDYSFKIIQFEIIQGTETPAHWLNNWVARSCNEKGFHLLYLEPIPMLLFAMSSVIISSIRYHLVRHLILWIPIAHANAFGGQSWKQACLRLSLDCLLRSNIKDVNNILKHCLTPPGSIGNPSHHLRQDTVPVRHTVAGHICKNHRHIWNSNIYRCVKGFLSNYLIATMIDHVSRHQPESWITSLATLSAWRLCVIVPALDKR